MPDIALHAALKDELAALERMIALLQQEQEVLTRARIEQLAEISDQKARQVAQLEHLTAERRSLMLARNIPDDGSAISDWLSRHEPDLLETWQTLIDLARQAAQYNRSNGRLIASREEANRALMGLLLNERSVEDTGYTADGQLAHKANRRRLDRA